MSSSGRAVQSFLTGSRAARQGRAARRGGSAAASLLSTAPLSGASAARAAVRTPGIPQPATKPTQPNPQHPPDAPAPGARTSTTGPQHAPAPPPRTAQPAAARRTPTGARGGRPERLYPPPRSGTRAGHEQGANRAQTRAAQELPDFAGERTAPCPRPAPARAGHRPNPPRPPARPPHRPSGDQDPHPACFAHRGGLPGR